MFTLRDRAINTIMEYLSTEDMNATYLKNIKIGRKCYSIVELKDNRYLVPCYCYLALGIRGNDGVCVSKHLYDDSDKPTKRELFDNFDFIFEQLLE